VEAIFNEDFPNIELHLQDMGKVGHETQIPQSTLYRRYKAWRVDHDWRPWRLQAHAEHERIFTNEKNKRFANLLSPII
jgi:hypothetical protein